MSVRHAGASSRAAPVTAAGARDDHAVVAAARRPLIALAACLAVLVAFAWTNRNFVDDAFISFRYAENFANGRGVVWNPGERVEGCTNFLWTILIGVAMKAGLEPVAVSLVLGVAVYLAALVLFYVIAVRVLGSAWHAVVATALLGANFSFNLNATGGLGTHLQTALLLACVAILLRAPERQGPTITMLVGVSVLAAVAIVARMDSFLPLGCIFLAALVLVWRADAAEGPAPARLAALLVPGAVLAGAWLFWKWQYYGDILPNTFYVKVASVPATRAGLYYLYVFFLSYLLFPFVALIAAVIPRVEPRREWPIVVAAAIVVSWCAYVVRIGGDFIEFRFMSPMLPFLFLLIYWSILRAVPSTAARVALVALIALGSIHHQLTFGKFIFANYMYRPSLANLTIPDATASSPTLWSELEVGQYLGRVFDYDPDVKVAVGAAGVIPYYSKLGALDILGLNDAWVAHHGKPLRFEQYIGGIMPGHVRVATVAYMVERKVNLFIGPGLLVRDDRVGAVRSMIDLLTVMFLEDEGLARSVGMRRDEFPPDARVVAIPVRPGYELLAIYVTPSPHVDRVIAAQDWRTSPLRELADL